MKKLRNYLREKAAVFGLTSIQSFFAIILAVALLAYVIVVIMGTLQDSTILTKLSAGVTNESVSINRTGITLSQATLPGFGSAAGTSAVNNTSGTPILAGNYTLTAAGVLTNSTGSPVQWSSVGFSYTYVYNSPQQNGVEAILRNTSTGVAGFFGSVNPVYSILAILVIILVLVVLVRVVTGSSSGNREGSVPL